MVYESDFYTTRRPYSRPNISSYSVTRDPRYFATGYSYHHNIPYVAHKRITTVTAPPHSLRTRPSIIMAEIDRINYRMRPSLSYQPSEDFLCTPSIMTFDDETRSIRAQTAAILKRINTPVPRPVRQLPIFSTSYEESPIPDRITSDAYINRLLGKGRNIRQEVDIMSHYNEPARRSLGKGHLACVSYHGGRAFARRRNLFHDDDDKIRNDVKFLSHYEKNRQAANHPQIQVEGTQEQA